MRTKRRFILWTAVSVAVLSASACAPAVPSQPALIAPAQTQAPSASATASLPPSLTPDTSALDTPTAIQPIATSRGPNLEATDPTTVNLASGQVQLIEFFRFT